MSIQRLGRVKHAWRGRLGIPPAVRERLETIESDCLTLRASVEARSETVRRSDSVEDLRAVIQMLTTFLDDPRTGVLQRALTRPHELDERATGRMLLEAAWDRLQQEARRALARADALETFDSLWSDLAADFADVLPWHYRDALRRWRVDPGAIAARGEAPFIRVKTRALEEIRAELRELQRAMPRRVTAPRECINWPDGVALEEIAAAVERARTITARHPSLERRRRLRVLSDQTRRRLAEEVEDVSWDVGLARELVTRSNQGFGGRFDDIDPRALLLFHAMHERADAPEDAADAAIEEDIGIAWDVDTPGLDRYFIAPLFGEYAVLRRHGPTPMMVTGDSFACGDIVWASVALPPGIHAATTPVVEWASGLFEVPEVSTGAELHTAKPAKLRLFARLDDEHWAARIERTGVLEHRSDASRGSSISLRGASRDLDADAVQLADPLVGDEQKVAGLLIRPVAVPVDDHPRAHLHTVSHGGNLSLLVREQQFLRLAQRRTVGLLPRPIGSDRRTGGALYAPPLAVTIAQSKILSGMRDSGTQLTILACAIARLWKRLTTAEVALGLYHIPLLAFTVRSNRTAEGPFRIEAVAIAAPFGTPLGDRYGVIARAPKQMPTHARIGGPPLHEMIAEWGIATAVTEARLAALAVLELLAVDALQAVSPRDDWDHFVAALRDNVARSHHVGLAQHLTDALQAPADGIATFMSNLADAG